MKIYIRINKLCIFIKKLLTISNTFVSVCLVKKFILSNSLIQSGGDTGICETTATPH